MSTSSSAGPTQSAKLGKYRELVEDIREAMLVTDDQKLGYPRARPMSTSNVGDDGSLWFFTKEDTAKVSEIYHDRKVCVAYSKPADKSYVSVSGKAELVDDPKLKKEFYSPLLDAWFDGPEDPEATLIKVTPHEVEYWDDNDSSLITMAKIAATAIAGGDYDTPENEKIEL